MCTSMAWSVSDFTKSPFQYHCRPFGKNGSNRPLIAGSGISPNPKDAEALKTWGRGYWKAIHPFNLAGAYVNFMMDDEAEGRVQATYGENYKRLAKAKTKYDPKNLFRVNQNVLPG